MDFHPVAGTYCNSLCLLFYSEKKKVAKAETIEESVDPYEEALLAIEELQGEEIETRTKAICFQIIRNPQDLCAEKISNARHGTYR